MIWSQWSCYCEASFVSLDSICWAMSPRLMTGDLSAWMSAPSVGAGVDPVNHCSSSLVKQSSHSFGQSLLMACVCVCVWVCVCVGVCVGVWVCGCTCELLISLLQL